MNRRHVLGLVGTALLTLAGFNAAASEPITKATKAACPCCGAGCECAKCSCTAASKALMAARGCDCCKASSCCPLVKKAKKPVVVASKPLACCPSSAKTLTTAPTVVK